MFESDQRKQLKTKYNKLAGMSGPSTGKKGLGSLGVQGSNSVYGELKLSEQLHDELYVVRDQVLNMKEALEEAVFLNTKYQKELKALKKDLQKRDTEIC